MQLVVRSGEGRMEICRCGRKAGLFLRVSIGDGFWHERKWACR